MNLEKEHITRNLYRFYTRIAELNGFDLGKIADCEFVWNRKGRWPSYFLGVSGTARIPELVQAIENKKAPSFCIVESVRKREVELLEDSGIRRIREWKGMYLDSRHYTSNSVKKDIRHIQLRMDDRSVLDDWLGLVNEELMSGVQIEKAVIKNLFVSDVFQFVVAYSEGQPAGSGLSFREHGICGLYMIATRGPLRGRGIGSMVTASLIEHAIDRGDKGIVLQATDLGAGLYSRMGFREMNRISVMWYLGK